MDPISIGLLILGGLVTKDFISPPPKKCSTCNGTGVIYNRCSASTDCGRCNGTGWR